MLLVFNPGRLSLQAATLTITTFFSREYLLCLFTDLIFFQSQVRRDAVRFVQKRRRESFNESLFRGLFLFKEHLIEPLYYSLDSLVQHYGPECEKYNFLP